MTKTLRRFRAVLVPSLVDKFDYNRLVEEINKVGPKKFQVTRQLARILASKSKNEPVMIEHQAMRLPVGHVRRVFTGYYNKTKQDALWADLDITNLETYDMLSEGGLREVSMQHFQDNLNLSKSRLKEVSLVHEGARPYTCRVELVGTEENGSVTNGYQACIKASASSQHTLQIVTEPIHSDIAEITDMDEPQVNAPPVQPQASEIDPTKAEMEQETQPDHLEPPKRFERRPDESMEVYILRKIESGGLLTIDEREQLARGYVGAAEQAEKLQTELEESKKKNSELEMNVQQLKDIHYSTIIPLARKWANESTNRNPQSGFIAASNHEPMSATPARPLPVTGDMINASLRSLPPPFHNNEALTTRMNDFLAPAQQQQQQPEPRAHTMNELEQAEYNVKLLEIRLKEKELNSRLRGGEKRGSREPSHSQRLANLRKPKNARQPDSSELYDDEEASAEDEKRHIEDEEDEVMDRRPPRAGVVRKRSRDQDYSQYDRYETDREAVRSAVPVSHVNGRSSYIKASASQTPSQYVQRETLLDMLNNKQYSSIVEQAQLRAANKEREESKMVLLNAAEGQRSGLYRPGTRM